MAGRRYAASDVSIDRYDDRRDRGPRGGRDRYDDRYREEEVEYKSRGPARERIVREDDRERDRSRHDLPFLREDYGRPPAGAMVLARREREDFEFAPRERRRSPSPETERKREEIIIRKDESDSRPPPGRREPSRDREEIIIRRTEDDDRRSAIGGRRDDREREEIIIRKDERDRDYLPPRREEHDREEIIIRTDTRDDDIRSRRGGHRDDHDSREEIIIKRSERDDDIRSRRGRDEHDTKEEIIIRRNEDEGLRPRAYDDYALTRRVSRERERSRHDHESDDEIIIRRDTREGGRGGDRKQEEIIIRKGSRSRSSSPISSGRGLEPPAIYAPPIHREVITHYRNVDHGFEVRAPRAISRPPSPPMPPPPRERSEERIEIHRSGEKNGRAYDEDIIIDRNDGGPARARAPVPPPGRDPEYGALARREPYRGYDRNLEEEADYYNRRTMDRAYIGEARDGATRDWGLVDVPPGTDRVRMNGVGGGEQEITWQRYNGVRRSKFYPEGGSDAGYDNFEGRLPGPDRGGEIGGRWGKPRDSKDGLWTEITKDLVVKEAIKEMGYEYEETEEFYYVMQHLGYVSHHHPTLEYLANIPQEDVARLVGLSEDIRRDRHKRIKEMEWENRLLPKELIEEERPRLAIEGPPRREERGWDREEERYIERDIVMRGGRGGAIPPGWRR